MSVPRTIAIGFALFLGFAVAFAPAALVRTVLPQDAGVELLEPDGTLWNGTGRLYLGGQPAGRLGWRFEPVTILQATLGYAVTLSGPEHELSGTVAAGPGSLSGNVSGQARAAFVNRWLQTYDITISGDLEFADVAVRVPYDYAAGAPGSASGSVTWDGGPVRYRLAGNDYAGRLPPLVAYLGEGLQTVIYPQEGQTPLLTAEIQPNGFARIGVTQLLTRLVGNPWPGSHADHEVVLEVEEQLF